MKLDLDLLAANQPHLSELSWWAFEYGPVGIAVADRDFHILNANSALCAMLGYTEAELRHRNVAALSHPDDVADELALIEEVRGGLRDGYELEKRYGTKGGKVLWAQVRLGVIRNENGVVLGSVVVIEDVTERRQAERDLAERAQMAALGADVGAALTQSMTLSEMLHRCAEAIVTHLGAAFARIWTLDADGKVLELQASAGMYTHLDGPHSRVPIGQLKIGLIAQERRSHITNSVCDDPRVSDREWAKREGMVAFAGYPLLLEQQVVGVVALFARHPLTQFATALLGSVADEIAVGIQRRRSEEALRRSEDRYRNLVENLNDVVFSTDLAGNLTYVSPAIERVFGYRADEVTNRPFANLIYPEDLAGVIASRARTLAGQGRPFEFRGIDKRGTVRWLRSSSSPLFDGDRLVGGTGVVADVTERKHAEEALRHAHAHLSHVVSSSPVVLYSLKIAGDRLIPVWVSDNFERITGYSIDESFSIEWWMERVHPDDRAALPKSVAELARDHGSDEYRFRRADGSYMWIRNQARLLRDSSGQPVEIVGSWADVTDRKVAQETVRQTRNQLTRVLSLSPVVIYALTIEGGRIASVWNSDNITRVTGYPRDETLSLDWWLQHIHPDDRRALPTLTAILKQEHALREFRFRFADGSYAWIRDEVRVLRDGEGRPVEIVGAWADITEYKRTQEAVRRGERRFRTLIERSRDLVSILDRNGVYRYANPAHEEVFGCEVGDLVSRLVYEFLHPDDAQDLGRRLMEAPHTAMAAAAAEYRLRHRDGSWHHFEGVTLNLLDDPDVGGILVTGRDITERKREEERSALLLEFSQDIRGTYDLDELLDRVQARTARVLPCDGVITFCWRPEQQAFCAIGDYGIAPDLRSVVCALRFGFDEPFGGRLREGGGQTIIVNDFRRAPPGLAKIAERLGIAALIAAPLRVRGRHLGSLAVVRNGGAPFDQNHANLCTGIAGQLAIALEALELQRQQRDDATVSAALARVGHELISSLDRAELGQRLCRVTTDVLGCDFSYTVVWTPNEDACQILAAFGLPEEEWEAVRVLRLPADAVAGLMALVHEGAVEVDTANPPSTWAAMPARYGVALALYVPLRRGDEIVGFHAAALRQREPGFTEQQRRIARGIAELASAGLENARLHEELERASRLKSEFLATMSHELRTPLNAITGYTDLMLEGAFGALAPEQGGVLRRVHLKAGELLDLISATLDLSRLEAGRLPLQLSEIRVSEWIEQIAAELQESQKESGVELLWEVAAELPLLRTDSVKLKVVLKNLIGNAIKFTDRGTVTVEARARDAGIEFAVTDTGVGISAEVLPIIFEAFRQGDSSSTRRHGGVGLGLYIVRRLLDLLGGTVAVESELGRGSTFRVWFPAADVAGPGAAIR